MTSRERQIRGEGVMNSIYVQRDGMDKKKEFRKGYTLKIPLLVGYGVISELQAFFMLKMSCCPFSVDSLL